MHKDERTKVKVAPTNQSDSGWRAELSWQVNDCDGGNGLNRAQGLWTDFCAVLSPAIDLNSNSSKKNHQKENCLRRPADEFDRTFLVFYWTEYGAENRA